MAGFVQIIEFDTSRIDEVRALANEFQGSREAGRVRRGEVTADRDHPGHYLTVVEFDSYDSAMENSRRPDTAEFSARMAQLCDGPPTFHNLDVLETFDS